MVVSEPKPSASPAKGVPDLVKQLAAAEAELQAVAGGEVDAVIDPSGHSYLLRQAQETLRRNEERFRALIEHSSDAVSLLDEKGKTLYVSQAVTRILGYGVDEFLGRNAFELMHPADELRTRGLFRQLLQTPGQSVTAEFQYRHKDGSWRWIEGTGTNLIHLPGVHAVVTNFHDITARKRAEERIRFQASLLDQTRNAVKATDLDGKIIFWNRSSELLYQWTAEEVMGRPIHEVTVASGSQQRVDEVRQTLLTTGYWEGELILQRKDGTTFPAFVFDTVIRDENGEVTGFVGISTDVTERKKLEAQLQHAQRIESIGLLAGGIAHDFNNILTVIQGHAVLMESGQNRPNAISGAVRHILQAVERATALTRQLLTFSRRQIVELRNLDLNQVAHSLARMMRPLLGEDISLLVLCSNEPALIHADQGMIEQVLMNLAVNARDAMPHGGELTIRTSLETISAADARRHPEAYAGECICLQVSDTGCGIPAENMAHIFEPFYTTKQAGKGTGLGLATVYGIVKKHRGWTEVSSTVGEGTRFRVYLPRTAEPIDVDARPVRKNVRGGTETILVVEDELPVRELLTDFFRHLGYQVHEAASGVAALQIWEQHKDEIKLLLTDMVMPGGLSGRDLAQKLEAANPKLKIVFTSGYSADSVGEGLDLREGVNFLKKPYDPEFLAQTIRECLDRK